METLAHETSKRSALDVIWARQQFPALSQSVNGHPAAFFDGPGGTQVPQRVIDAISDYLARNNANTGGAYATSRNTDVVLAGARSAMADFLNCDPREVVFGANMTALTFAISRSIGRDLKPGDEILLTLLDHDANFSPWKALEEDGVVIRTVNVNPTDCTLDMDDFARKLSPRTKLVAVGCASNAVGTINDVKKIVRMARDVGALSYLDAVHSAPHHLTDVRALDCDFLVCSTYKFFGPHMGVLYGKAEHLERLRPYKVRPNTNAIPYRWEWGTLNHECIAGITACVDYLADVGRRTSSEKPTTRRGALVAAFEAIHTYEQGLMAELLPGLLAIHGLKVYGITDPACMSQRCPTFAIRIEGQTPHELATKLGDRGFFLWDGMYYALNLVEVLGVAESGGFLRIGLTHYNTREEVRALLKALREIVG